MQCCRSTRSSSTSTKRTSCRVSRHQSECSVQRSVAGPPGAPQPRRKEHHAECAGISQSAVYRDQFHGRVADQDVCSRGRPRDELQCSCESGSRQRNQRRQDCTRAVLVTSSSISNRRCAYLAGSTCHEKFVYQVTVSEVTLTLHTSSLMNLSALISIHFT